MINLKIEGETYPIKNELSELTIGEFEVITTILNDEKFDSIDRWVNLFIHFGIPADIIEDIDLDDFLTLTRQFSSFTETPSSEVVQTIEIEGKKYHAYDETFKVTVKESGLIETAIQKKSDKYLGEMMAIIYKLEGTERTIWYDQAHLKHKAELFRTNVTVEKTIPIINHLSKKLIKDVNLIERDANPI